MNPIKESVKRLRAFLFRRRQAYLTTFEGPVAAVVLEDLARFCRAHRSTFHQDTHLAARLDGRREVFLRIASQLNLSEEQIWDLYGRPDLGD